jgi:hypothetical protein
MAESLVLTDPEVTPQVVTTEYHVVFLLKDTEQARLVVHVRGTNGERKVFTYEDDQAIAFIKQLNKSNNSTKSEQRRILEQLTADGHLVGTVTGTPDP